MRRKVQNDYSILNLNVYNSDENFQFSSKDIEVILDFYWIRYFEIKDIIVILDLDWIRHF